MTDSTANPTGFDTHSGPRTDRPFGPQAGQNFLRRPFTGRMLAGVAAGAARYLGVDPPVPCSAPAK
jgi:hypothetical protein